MAMIDDRSEEVWASGQWSLLGELLQWAQQQAVTLGCPWSMVHRFADAADIIEHVTHRPQPTPTR
jgi:hypothetical protein